MRRWHPALPAFLLLPLLALAGIERTVHNLGTTGPGEIRAVTEERICIFCHAPHHGSGVAPLWNHQDSRASYVLYDSSTLDALPGQPTGASKMCLGCHDGTVALGAVVSEPNEIEFPSGQRYLDPSTGSLETDLADDHPVSFPYDAALAAADPQLRHPDAIVPPVHLDATGQVQCTSCHDPHTDVHPKFLVGSPTGGALCTGCHDRTNWATSSHATSRATWDGTPPDPWPGSGDRTVADNACRNCHAPHHAAQPPRLVRRYPEEETCWACHDGHVASTDIRADFQATSHHPVELTSGVHDPEEDILTAPRHVECVDCHEPHQVEGSAASPPALSGKQRGIDGIDSAGNPVDPASQAYEVCFKCHGDGTSASQAIPRTAGEINTRLEFGPDAISYHPVVQAGRNSDVPSLLPPWTEGSLMYCTDCHASDRADAGGPSGPHGSSWPFILRRRYETEDYTRENPDVYALCYECHSRSTILSGRSGFRLHRKHVLRADTPCSVCHDPHGVSAQQGTPDGNAHLISFDTRVVQPSRSGQLRYESTGPRRGRCWLTCHGKNHDPKRY